MKQDKIEKLVTILIKAEGVEETIDKIDEFGDKVGETTEAAAAEADAAEPKIQTFLQRWRTQLALVAGAIGAIWGLSKYSQVASSSMNAFGSILGMIADTILITMLPELVGLMDWMIGFQEWVEELPEPVKKLTGYVVLLGWALKLLSWAGITKGITGLAGWGIGKLAAIFGITEAGGIVATLETMLVAGGGAAAASLLLSIGAGLLLGGGVVWLLDKIGVLDLIDETGRQMEEDMPGLFERLKHNPSIVAMGTLGIIVVDLVRGDWDSIWPDLKSKIYDEWWEIEMEKMAVWEKFFDDIRGPLLSWLNDAGAAIGEWCDAREATLQRWADRVSAIISNALNVVNLGWIDDILHQTGPGANNRNPGISVPPSQYYDPSWADRLKYQGSQASGGHIRATGKYSLEEGEYVMNRYETDQWARGGRSPTGGGSGDGGGITIQNVIIKGEWKSEESLYNDFVARLQRESRRVRG